MKVGLFIPCYVDQFYPQVGVATLQLLEKYGCTVGYPANQTCCGQPMANSGFEHLARGCNELFIKNFRYFDYIVCPSGSCTLHIKEHLHGEEKNPGSGVQGHPGSGVRGHPGSGVRGHPGSAVQHREGGGGEGAADAGRLQKPSGAGEGAADEAAGIRRKIYELVEFLTDVLKIETIGARFPHKVGLHQSCHGQRGLKLSQMTELVAPPFSKPEHLLKMVDGVELVELDRKDECCGFGGTFCVAEEAVSVKMGKDRVADHAAHGAEYITAADMSCLMHLEGILHRQKSPVKVIHIAEILNAK